MTGFDVTDHPSHYIDESIAAGPQNLVVTNNGSVTVRTKSGAVVATATLSGFFDPVRDAGESAFDVRVLFDQGAGRFFVMAAGRACQQPPCLSHIFIAVSRDDEPTSLGGAEWLFHSLDAALDNSTLTDRWADFPSLGISSDAVVVTMQMFPWNEPATAFNKVLKLRVLKKSELLAGTISGWTDFSGFTDPSNGATLRAALQPAHHFGNSATFFVVTLSEGGCGYVVLGIANAATTPAITSRRVPASLGCTQAGNASQPGGQRPLFNAGGMRTPPVVRDGSLWLARSVGKTINAVTAPGVYWTQINVSGWPTATVSQQGEIGVSGVSLFYPTLAVDSLGRMIMIYARSSTDEFPSLYVTGRLASDPPGTVRSSILLKAGTASLNPDGTATPLSFADYFGAALDPADGTVWVIGEYVRTAATSDRWAGNVTFDDGFTDSPLAAGTTIRAVHITEARQRIDAARLRAGLPAFAWTDNALAAGSSQIRHEHVTELRSALVSTYAQLGRTAPSFTDGSLAGQTIKAIHLIEIRMAVVAIE